MNELLLSSDDSHKLSTTVEGTLTVVLSIIIMLGAQYGFSVPEESINLIIQQVVESIGYSMAMIGSLIALYGSVKKFYFKVVSPEKV